MTSLVDPPVADSSGQPFVKVEIFRCGPRYFVCSPVAGSAGLAFGWASDLTHAAEEAQAGALAFAAGRLSACDRQSDSYENKEESHV